METSCVNREIRIFNRKLQKFTEVFKHVSIIEMNNDRETFTSHGLHLNNLGQQQIAKQVANEIRRLIDRKVSNIIGLDWKQVSEETSPNRIIEQTDKSKQLRSNEMRNMGNSSTKVLKNI
jgi:flagellar biosynthesis regulator FlbT